jgi:hypothetical protein
MAEEQDACYHKVRSRYKVWPSAYASGALVQCRKKGAANWGTGGKNVKEDTDPQLDEGIASKIASMALGLALAVGATTAGAEEMWVYQDASTKKLRVTKAANAIPADALMSFKVDTDDKTVSMIKGNQMVPVQTQPAVVQQTQQQVQSTQTSPAPKVVQQTQQQVQQNTQVSKPSAQNVSPGVIYRDNDWVAKFSKGAMDDKSNCTIFSKDNRYVQVDVDKNGPTTLYVSYSGRGGIESYRYRVDSNPATNRIYASNIDKKISAIGIPFKSIAEGNTLTVEAITILNDIKTDKIDIGSLQPAIDACQKAMNQ